MTKQEQINKLKNALVLVEKSILEEARNDDEMSDANALRLAIIYDVLLPKR
jgi:hypothetical protein